MLKKYYLQFKQSAFTLAETLIVMGIIGVVAALTLPNLNSSTGDKEKVVKLQKLYSNLQDAFDRAQVVYGPLNGWKMSSYSEAERNYRSAERILEFMKLSKSCGLTDIGSCFKNHTDELMPSYILADGTSLAIWVDPSCSSDYDERCGAFAVDIDGFKGKAQQGSDVFAFVILEDGIYPLGGRQDSRTSTDALVQANCIKLKYTLKCTGWVIENGNMDYLKTNSSGQCPDGKTVLDWTTNTTCK